jgi:hypothetical protein
MVTILPKQDDWAKAFENIGSGFSQGYMNRSDENALRAAVDKLGPNPNARDLLNAITSTKTHSPAAKQRMLENYLGVEKFEELRQQAREQEDYRRSALEETQRHNYVQEFLANQKLIDEAEERRLKSDEKSANQTKESRSASYLIDNSKLPDEKKQKLRDDFENGLISYQAVKDTVNLNKEDKGTQASRPIDPKQREILDKVRDDPEYQKAPAKEKYKMLTSAGLSRENAETEYEIEKDQEERTQKERELFHKETEKYDEDLSKATRAAKTQISAIDDTIKSIKSGNVKPSSAANVFRFFGDIGKKISDALLNKDQATLNASIPAFLEGRKELFGVRLSDADLRLLQDKLPDIGKSVEVNMQIMKLMKKYAQQSLLRGQIAADIKAKNGGYRPARYADLIEDEFDEMTRPIDVIDPEGNKVSIPHYLVGAALKKGGKLAKEEENPND